MDQGIGDTTELTVSDPRPLYLHAAGVDVPVFAVFHPAAAGRRGGGDGTAIIFSPPFGYDEVCAHRGLRAWARWLAPAGRPVLRLDLPGTGDSGGSPRDPGRATSWPAALAAGAAWLRAETGAARVVAVGVGLGGLIAVQAVAAGAPIDDLVLWATPARGRRLVRELQTFSRLGITAGEAPFDFDAAGLDPLPAGAVEAGGFLLSGESVEALRALDVAELDLPDGARRSALLLSRDGISVDDRLADALASRGVRVERADGPGYNALVDEPHRSTPPTEVIATVDGWLDRLPASDGTAPSWPVPKTTAAVELDGAVRELPLSLELAGGGRADGVLAEPATAPAARDLTVVLLNVGAERRIGFNRMWVEAARRWAPHGVPVVRVDLPGIGDASGPASPWQEARSLYTARLVEDARRVLDGLQAHGLPGRFLVVGVCASAYWAFQLALRDPRISRLTLVNAFMLLYDDSAGTADEVHHLRRLVRPAAWRDVLAEGVTLARVARKLRALLVMARLLPQRVAARLSARMRGGDALDLALDALRDRGVALDLLFSDGEPLLERLRRDGHLDRLERWPQTTYRRIVGPPSTHTVQLVRMQPSVHAMLDEALAAERGRVADHVGTVARP